MQILQQAVDRSLLLLCGRWCNRKVELLLYILKGIEDALLNANQLSDLRYIKNCQSLNCQKKDNQYRSAVSQLGNLICSNWYPRLFGCSVQRIASQADWYSLGRRYRGALPTVLGRRRSKAQRLSRLDHTCKHGDPYAYKAIPWLSNNTSLLMD